MVFTRECTHLSRATLALTTLCPPRNNFGSCCFHDSGCYPPPLWCTISLAGSHSVRVDCCDMSLSSAACRRSYGTVTRSSPFIPSDKAHITFKYERSSTQLLGIVGGIDNLSWYKRGFDVRTSLPVRDSTEERRIHCWTGHGAWRYNVHGASFQSNIESIDRCSCCSTAQRTAGRSHVPYDLASVGHFSFASRRKSRAFLHPVVVQFVCDSHNNNGQQDGEYM